MDISKDIQDQIDKHLPGMVGDQLRKALEKGDNDAIRANEAERRVAELNKIRDRLTVENAELNSNLDKHGKLADRESAVAERERNAEIAALKVQLDAEKRYGTAVAAALTGLVRNIEFRRSAFESRTQPYGQDGYNTRNTTDSSSETRSAD